MNNSLTPESGWPLISPHNISLKSNRKVMRIKEMITHFRNPLLSIKNTPCQYHGKFKENSAEI